MLNKAVGEISKLIKENNDKIKREEKIHSLYLKTRFFHKQKPRTDLNSGEVVVVLEGRYVGLKVIFLKQIENNMAIVSGIKEINNIGVFQINEKYLFKLSVNIGNILYDFSNINLYESKINENNEEDGVIIDENLNKIIWNAIIKIEFLKGYLSEPFKVDNTIEFYSQKY